MYIKCTDQIRYHIQIQDVVAVDFASLYGKLDN